MSTLLNALPYIALGALVGLLWAGWLALMLAPLIPKWRLYR